MFYTYILRSEKNNSYYTGSCRDLTKRVELHNRELIKSTKRYCPWELVHFEEYDNLKMARKREIEIKSWKKRTKIDNLIKSPKF